MVYKTIDLGLFSPEIFLANGTRAKQYWTCSRSIKKRIRKLKSKLKIMEGLEFNMFQNEEINNIKIKKYNFLIKVLEVSKGMGFKYYTGKFPKKNIRHLWDDYLELL